jgi:glycosyltransferase involved in cell wall biosynthesis
VSQPAEQSATTVAAVVPTHDRGALLERALESVFAQTRPPDELIVVDDGSTDDTPERLRRLAPRVRCIRQPNRGGAAARNLGARSAASEWIAFLDDDDVWAPDHLERVAAAIAATGGAAGFYFRDTERLAADGSRRSQWETAGLKVRAPHQLEPDATAWALMPTQPFMLQAAVFRRALLLEQGGLDESLVRRHDTDLFLRLAIGRGACAVAGAGATVSADDRSGGRLTERWDGRSQVYWDCTVRMYRKALDASPGLADDERRELASRLASAELRRLRLGWRSRQPALCAGALFGALRAAPGLTVRRAARKLFQR